MDAPGSPGDAAAAPAAGAASRRGPCASCGAAGRYTCPGCGASSCSAACVGAHKAAAGCAGKRRRAAFVALKAFDDATLRSDLRLLEDTALAAERARRARSDAEKPQQGLPRAAQALQKAARERGTELLFQAPGMARREGNTSGIRHKSKTIVWHVEWVFAGTDVRAQGRVAEDIPLSVGLAAQLGSAAPGGAATRHALRDFVAAADAAKAAAAAPQQPGAEPQLPPPPPLLLFLEKVGVAAASTARWLPLRAELPLKDQLAGKWLLEHPTVHVALPAQADAYPLADGAAPEPPPAGNKWI